jgi:uncharacterized protein YprB with RNaseH-like and TPR domain
MKTLIFDIETAMSLKADIGWVLCIGWKWLGEKTCNVIRIDETPEFKKDHTNDKGVLSRFYEVLKQADMVVTWNGKRFDMRFLQGRHLLQHLPPLPNLHHWDGLLVARESFTFTSNRLANIQELVEAKESKSPLTKRTWQQAIIGERKALSYVVEHCRRDVLVTEEVYNRLRSVGTKSPNLSSLVGDDKACPRCGKRTLVKQGTRIASAKVHTRYQCSSCGGWSHGAPFIDRSVKPNVAG